MSRRIDTTLTLAALERAITLRQPAPGLIHHSDRGVPYASQADVERLTVIGAPISMAATGNPDENAQAAVYNQKRLHSSLGYCPPMEFEQIQVEDDALRASRVVR